jgi:hypothetical protein
LLVVVLVDVQHQETSAVVVEQVVIVLQLR